MAACWSSQDIIFSKCQALSDVSDVMHNSAHPAIPLPSLLAPPPLAVQSEVESEVQSEVQLEVQSEVHPVRLSVFSTSATPIGMMYDLLVGWA